MSISINANINGQNVRFTPADVTNMFHVLYYESRVWTDTHWFGQQILKCPLDMWIYQEMLWNLKPDFIIECGTFRGGSALFYAHLFDLIGHGEIITIDVLEQPDRPQHKRIHYLDGSSTDPEMVDRVKNMIGKDKKVLIILDSDHACDHVLEEMRVWKDVVTEGSYMIVEDSNVNGHPARPDHGPGPMEAIDAFMQENDQFEIDLSKEKFFMTQNPRGYLRKKL
jgi:cephalosporin hydroxylase